MRIRVLLSESIADSMKYYTNIEPDVFNFLIRLDPTFDESKDKLGTYGKWILALVNRKSVDADKNDVISNETGEVLTDRITELLSDFEKNKNILKEKDINKFKSVYELDDYLSDDNSYNELTNRQITRQRQKARRGVVLGRDAELLGEDDEYEVWVPLNYAASCKLGEGTSWCTASTSNDGWWEHYTRGDAKLYIIIPKDNPDKGRYQFSFDYSDFRDVHDVYVDPKPIINDSELLSDLFGDFVEDIPDKQYSFTLEESLPYSDIYDDFVTELLDGEDSQYIEPSDFYTLCDSHSDFVMDEESINELFDKLGFSIPDDMGARYEQKIRDRNLISGYNAIVNEPALQKFVKSTAYTTYLKKHILHDFFKKVDDYIYEIVKNSIRSEYDDYDIDEYIDVYRYTQPDSQEERARLLQNADDVFEDGEYVNVTTFENLDLVDTIADGFDNCGQTWDQIIEMVAQQSGNDIYNSNWVFGKPLKEFGVI